MHIEEIYVSDSGKYFGMVKEITKITVDELKPLNQQELNLAFAAQEASGKTPEDWAAGIDLTKPTNVTIFSDGEIKLNDDHLRYLAAKIRSEPLNINMQAINTKNPILNETIARVNEKLHTPDGELAAIHELVNKYQRDMDIIRLDANSSRSSYYGRIIDQNNHYVVQSIGAGVAIIHPLSKLDKRPATSDMVSIGYSMGHGTVSEGKKQKQKQDISLSR